MKLWVDDYRYPPDGWVWAQTLADAQEIIEFCNVDEISFDHDLGGDDTTRPLVLYMIENKRFPIAHVHSANPVGVEWLEGMIRRYWE